MAIRSTDGTAEDTFFVADLKAPEGVKKTELVFDVVGTQHFLTQIWVAGEDQGHQVELTAAEKELLAKGATKTEHRVSAEHTMHKGM